MLVRMHKPKVNVTTMGLIIGVKFKIVSFKYSPFLFGLQVE